MKGDILSEARQKLLAEHLAQLPQAPADLNANYETEGGLLGVLAGASTGAAVGAQIGVVAGPAGAVAGTIPGAIVGGVMGYFGGTKVGQHVERDK